MDLHPQLVDAAAEAARIAKGVTADRLAGPTPCGDFDTRTLVNHWVLYTAYGLEKRARREPLPQEWLTRDFTAEPDWADTYAGQLDRAVRAWAEPAAWEGDIELGEGSSMPARAIAGMIVKELVVHGWDVAKATGQEIRPTEETAKAVLAVVEEHGEIYRQYKGFADPVEVPADASTFDRALGLSGRDPRWTLPA
ncbi:TIGR03086 family metal-binding protein [Yinghuangia seranimata]|uniref:TIGR03086 family metal-binding protein n=1 Tax=Yinghuangia seranimata TaxID=408067 RepID=UPI00248B6745|nr:TIGR03086 family metal-binding protein [Yinghuangia seranimata]MDI2132059.1 TIGR03086 family metal-binding protein [Yinghuangia seranimata]